MPERAPDTVVDDTELVGEATHEFLPVDAGLEVGMLGIEAGEEGRAKKKLGFAAWLAIAWLVILVGVCALAPLIGIPEYKERFDNLALQQPFCTASECVSGHTLGGDHLGRDMTSRLVYGARTSLFIAVGSVVIGIVVGGFLGLLAGYRRGRLETITMGAMDVLLSIPALILALSLAIFLEPTMVDVARVEGDGRTHHPHAGVGASSRSPRSPGSPEPTRSSGRNASS